MREGEREGTREGEYGNEQATASWQGHRRHRSGIGLEGLFPKCIPNGFFQSVSQMSSHPPNPAGTSLADGSLTSIDIS